MSRKLPNATIPTVRLPKHPTIRIGDIRQRRFDLIDRNAICPVCNKLFPNNARDHLASSDDPEHVTYLIHNA